MIIDETLEIANYEVGYIKNNKEYILLLTDDLEEAKIIYEKTIKKYSITNTEYHVIVYIYDQNKQCNINYYNNYDEM